MSVRLALRLTQNAAAALDELARGVEGVGDDALLRAGNVHAFVEAADGEERLVGLRREVTEDALAVSAGGGGGD